MSLEAIGAATVIRQSDFTPDRLAGCRLSSARAQVERAALAAVHHHQLRLGGAGAGEVVEVNDALGDAPETVNSDAGGSGWLFKLTLSDPGELDGLMDEAAYKAHTA